MTARRFLAPAAALLALAPLASPFQGAEDPEGTEQPAEPEREEPASEVPS